LSATGIAIGIATVVAVVSIPASSKADLLAELGRLGNLLTVQSGNSFDGAATPLPHTALGMIRRVPPVSGASETAIIRGASRRRSDAIPTVDTGGIAVTASDTTLLSTLGGTVQHGAFLNAATQHFPAVVLGRGTAQALGIADLVPPARVYLGGRYFSVVGIL